MRSLILASVGLALALAGLSQCAAAGDQAPDFKLPDLAGETIHLAEVDAENPVLVSFWATWCVPCPDEMKHLQRLYDEYRDEGLAVLAISIDGTKTVAKVKSFVNGRRFSYPVLYDTNNDVKRRYHVKAVPAIYLLRPGGELAYFHVGYRPGDEVALEKEIKSLLAELQRQRAQGDDAGNSDAATPPCDEEETTTTQTQGS